MSEQRFQFIREYLQGVFGPMPVFPDSLNAAHDEIVELYIENETLKREIQKMQEEQSDDLSLILRANNKDRLFISGEVNIGLLSIVFVKGDFSTLIVPMSWFEDRVDFSDIKIIDCGQTVAFGKYEIAVDTILKDFI